MATRQIQLEPGEIVEVRMQSGFRYVQITHRHSSYPEVVRVIEGVYQQRPELHDLGTTATDFIALCPVSDSLSYDNLNAQAIGLAPLPDHARAFPPFATPFGDRNGDVVYWWFWDGESLRFDAAPVPDAADLPRREVIGARELVSRMTTTGA